MSNRTERRASLATFKKAAAGGHLDTFLLPIDGPIAEPLHQRAVAFWRANIGTRRPKCFSCRAEFAEDARVGAYLLAVPSGEPSSCTTSALCADCWERLTDDAVKKVALRVIRRVMPTAVFDPEPPR
jgi:hypothetical protein